MYGAAHHSDANSRAHPYGQPDPRVHPYGQPAQDPSALYCNSQLTPEQLQYYQQYYAGNYHHIQSGPSGSQISQISQGAPQQLAGQASAAFQPSQQVAGQATAALQPPQQQKMAGPTVPPHAPSESVHAQVPRLPDHFAPTPHQLDSKPSNFNGYPLNRAVADSADSRKMGISGVNMENVPLINCLH